MLILHAYRAKYPNVFHNIYHNKTKYYIYLIKGDRYRITASGEAWGSVELATLNQVNKES